MNQIYSSVTKIMVDSRSGNNNLLYLPLDKLLQQATPVAPGAPVAATPDPAANTSGATSAESRSRDGQRGRDRDTR
jgi:membrane protease subunit HflK